MGHKINEGNSGYWSLDGEPKFRRTRKVNADLSAEEKNLLLQVVGKVIDCMAFDPGVSERGHLHPEAKFTDGGRFMLCLTREQYELLGSIYEKIENG